MANPMRIAHQEFYISSTQQIILLQKIDFTSFEVPATLSSEIQYVAEEFLEKNVQTHTSSASARLYTMVFGFTVECTNFHPIEFN